MTQSIAKEVAAMQRMTVPQLQARFGEAFGEPTRVHHKAWLIKRIAWRLQAIAEGDLSERARQRAAEIANDNDLRLLPPQRGRTAKAPAPTRSCKTSGQSAGPDNRLPPPGTVLARQYKGQTLEVKVLAKGFEYLGEIYKSLSAVAKAITGSHCNGYLFFRLIEQGVQS